MSADRLRRGSHYELLRSASAPLEVRFEADWKERTRTGRIRRRLLFSASRRALSRNGRKTRPKLIVGQTYAIQRTRETLNVRLVASTRVHTGRYLVLRPV